MQLYIGSMNVDRTMILLESVNNALVLNISSSGFLYRNVNCLGISCEAIAPAVYVFRQ